MTQAISRQSISSRDYLAFQAFLQDACGIVLGDGKEYLVASRLSPLMREFGMGTLGDLMNALSNNLVPRLKNRVVDAMTTNETFWFRDVAHFRMLTDIILAQQGTAGGPVRIWSAACSSGQEPYSLSMAAHEYLMRNPGRVPGGVEIVATDISTKMITEARLGVYCGVSISRGLNYSQRQQFFRPHGNGEDCLEVRPEIRRRVQFRELNLSDSYSLLGRFDVIFCRNVLIYFSSKLKKEILTRMAQSLKPGGYLFLGSTESLSGLSDTFEMMTASGGIVYRLKSR